MKKKLSLWNVIIVFIILIVLINGYLKISIRAFWPDEEVYVAEHTVTDEYGYEQKAFAFLEFTNDRKLNIIATTENCSAVKKTVLDYKLHAWDHIGDVHFKTDSILSFTVFKEDAIPTTMRLNCVQSRSATVFSLFEDTTTYENTEAVGMVYDVEAWFYEDSLFFDGMMYKRIAGIDPVYSELIRLFIDNDDIFYQYIES